MKEKTAMQVANMKKQTIGVEVEMNNITRRKAAKLAAEFFETGNYRNTAARNDSGKCELVTPILHYDDIEIL